MSDRNNDVFQVLVTTGNQAVLAAGNQVDDLAAGQIGVFDANTHQSISAATSPLPRDFYIAVGTNDSGGSTFEDFQQSAGQLIQRRNISGYTFGPHTASRPMIVDITNIKASCNQNYTVRIEQRNSKISRIQGFNQFSEAFSVRGACCEGCGTDCEDADPNDVAIKLYNAINSNSTSGLSAGLIALQGSITITTEPTADGNLTVTLGSETAITVPILNVDTGAGVATKIATAINAVVGTAYSAKGVGTTTYIAGPAGTVTVGVAATGTVATDVDVARTEVSDSTTFIDNNPGAKLGVAVQGAPVPTVGSDSVNLHFHKFHQTFLIVSLVETERDSIGCSFGTVTVYQELAEEEGSGYNIRQKEYHASSWNGAGPYVASDTTGLAIGNIKYRAVEASKYDQIILEYFQKSESGWLEYENVLSTIICTLEASTVTRNALLTILDALVTPLGFDALLDDAATASTTSTVVEAQPASEAVDGIA